MKKLILILVLCFTINSCKDKIGGKPIEKSKSQEQNDTFFSFIMNGNFENDDNIYFYYLTPEVNKITIKNSLNKSILGSDDSQTINFELPKDILPTRFFLRFGDHGKQKIKINNISLSYGNNTINVPDSLFYQYFKPNDSAIFNKEDNSIEAKSNSDQNPMFFSRMALEEKIDFTFL